ncbi:MAG: polysaccharide deacetylase family protein [Bacilli bacterium]|nr:polysaccharide deacetylase family protein [Bacilli bacterium]
MDKQLLKFYIYFFVSLLLSIIIFSNLFLTHNNTIKYITTKLYNVNNYKPIEVNIYNSRSNVIIMMDDGWESQYRIGYNYMEKYNIKGSIAVIPSHVGTTNYINKASLYFMYLNGWDLLNHTYSHYNLSKINNKKQKKEIKKGMDWLKKNNFSNNNILIYPEGGYNQDVLNTMDELGIINGRGTDEGFNPKNVPGSDTIKIKNVLSNINSNEVCNWIDKAIDNNLTLILLFHKLEQVTDKSLMQYDIGEFYKIIDYLYLNKDKLNIITYSDWIIGNRNKQ